MTQFTDPQVKAAEYAETEIGNLTIISPASTFVIGGEYKDEPDLIIEVAHATDADGLDVSKEIAERIAALLAGA